MNSPKKSGSKKKNFVLDTNVILHDYNCIDKFEDNDIFIPIVVLEELDKFKKGSEQINFNAREFVRRLDALTEKGLSASGVSLGEDRGKLYIYTQSHPHPLVVSAFSARIPDHQILSNSLSIAEEHKGEPTILVTKDVNLRMKGKSLGLKVEDYINDKIDSFDLFKSSELSVDGVDGDLIDKMYANPSEGIALSQLPSTLELSPNQCLVLKSERNSILARYDAFEQRVKKIEKQTLSGISPRNAEQSFAFEALTDPRIQLIGLSGKAGTGKTLLALAAALAQSEEYDQILLSRPIVALANKDLGFLPGDEKAKVTPYMQPLFDNLNVIKGLNKGGSEGMNIDQLTKDNRLVIEALAYIRGRSLSRSFVIVDEAQNLTPHEIKTIITRAGEGTKMVFTGDIEQIDSPYLDARSNGLAYMIDKMRNEPIFAHVNLIKGERSLLSERASQLL